MIFLIDPDGALLQGPDILSEDPDLDTAGAHAPGGRHDDDVTLHNSDFRDSPEYIQKQVWDERIFTRQSSSRLDLVKTRLVEACSMVCYDSTHTKYI